MKHNAIVLWHTNLNMNKRTNLVWIDLEMTGLIPETDVILEAALIITDGQLNMLHESPYYTIYQPDAVLQAMDTWCMHQHTQSGLIGEVRASTSTVKHIEQVMLNVIQEYCEPKKGILCGNSVWQDRIFLRNYMPRVTDFLHYRLLDVTSFKIALDRWYPDNPALAFEKQDAHRALPDIRESIAELRHYRLFLESQKSNF